MGTIQARARAFLYAMKDSAFLRAAFGRGGAEQLVAAVAVAYLVVQLARRLQYGVDGTDEAFYCALTHRYALGDWPYVDEVNLRQTAGLIALPFYWVYIKIRGDSDGVVLLCRSIYFCITCGVGYTVYAYARGKIGRALALLVAVTPVLYFPFALPTCSYNNLGCMFFTMGTFLGLRAAEETTRAKRFHYWSGIVHGVALVAYPPYIVPVVIYGALQLLAVRDRRWERTWNYFAGGATIGVLFLLILARAGYHGVRAALDYETSLVPPRTEAKFLSVVADIENHAPGQSAAIATTLAWIAAAKSFRGFRTWGTVLLLPWLAWIYAPIPLPPAQLPPSVMPPFPDISGTLSTAANGLDGHVRCIYFSLYTCLAAIAVLPLLRRGQLRRELALIGWLPSVFAGLTTGYASANTGAINAGMGAFCGGVVTLVAIPLVVGAKPDEEEKAQPFFLRLALLAALASVGFSHLRFAKRTMYRDQSIEMLTARVRIGPYAGLYTTPENEQRQASMVRKLRQLERPQGKVFAYYDYPAAYLMTLMRPAMPSVWTDARIPISSFMIERYAKNITGSGFIVRMTGVENHFGKSSFETMIEAPERLEYTDPYYKIYGEPDPALVR